MKQQIRRSGARARTANKSRYIICYSFIQKWDKKARSLKQSLLRAAIF
ncbi:MAG: hypothetical protein F6J93_37570 [Oscillatoria sp. SIO1A7]|nr:hypothetical protein [Oscillatoria sp. SIO1A7]